MTPPLIPYWKRDYMRPEHLMSAKMQAARQREKVKVILGIVEFTAVIAVMAAFFVLALW